MGGAEIDRWRIRAAYTVSQAARLAKTSPANVRRWLYGYQAPGHQMKPVFGPKQRDREQRAEVSFLVLAEIIVVAAFRKRNVKLERLRRAHAYAREMLGIEYPFASLRLRTDGVHVLSRFEEEEPGDSLLELDEYGQLTLPGVVISALEQFEFDDSQLALRWFPAGRSKPIVVDPRFAAGRPTIAHRGVTVETIYRRWKAGQPINFIASDFKLRRDIVEAALQYADALAA